MEKWDLIQRIIFSEKDKFKKAYKCVNKNIYIRPETIRKHINSQVNALESIRDIVTKNFEKFTKEHKLETKELYWQLRDLLVKVLAKYNIKQHVPQDINEPIKIDLNIIFIPETENTLPSVTEGNTDSETESETESVPEIEEMTQTNVEFLNTASRLLTEFDGKPENLRSFLDSIEIINSIKDTHETIAVSLIKTKLKGNARNIISNETTIAQITQKLQTTVKGESVEVLTAKLMSVRQNSKSANAYCSEVENLAKSLENAYISDGLTSEIAGKYSTQVAVKAMTKNCTIDKVKLIMEAGQFKTMNDVISKFVGSCTEATGQHNTILKFNQRPNETQYHGNRQRFQRKNNYSRNYNGYFSNINRNRYARNNDNNLNNNRNFRGQRRQGRFPNNSGNNIRFTNTNEQSSENPDTPLR